MSRMTATFGDLLRQLRTAAALSQEELAERAGVSLRGISDLERGVRRAPHLRPCACWPMPSRSAPETGRPLLAAARPAAVSADDGARSRAATSRSRCPSPRSSAGSGSWPR